ncbi:DUF3427 domain-containing protein [Paenibacillus sp. FSL W8-1187]|uniref:DUF3427 domain-containing protein n=1 Tax=Paenibacillus sp. FSL W8-1187 TaxID=2975339 RepID=UPI0030D83EED
MKRNLINCDFEVGEYYTRKDIYGIMNVPSDKQGGNWNTGYTRFNNTIFVFVNIGTAGRTGHDYPNRFDDSGLVWYGKTNSKLSHGLIQSIINSECKVYIFGRSYNKNPQFIFLGIGKVGEFEDSIPVKLTWIINNQKEILDKLI